MAIKLVENLANEIGVCHVYGMTMLVYRCNLLKLTGLTDFDVESLAYVALWVTSRYNDSCVINSPPCSNWITATPQMLALIRRGQLYHPRDILSSHKPFVRVYKAFFMLVRDHVEAAMMEAEVLTMQEPPDSVVSKFKGSMDEPLEELEVLHKIEEAQAHIRQDKSPDGRYRSFVRWASVITWAKQI